MKKLKKLLLILLFSIIALDICFIGFIIKDISIDFTSNNISEIEYSDDMKFKEPTAILKGKHVFIEGKKLELEQRNLNTSGKRDKKKNRNTNINNSIKESKICSIVNGLLISKLCKGGFDHFMLKEIYDQPNCLKDCMSGRLCDRK